MKSSLIALFTVAIVAMFSTSCKKVEDTTAEVRVVTGNSTPVPGAEVRLFGEGTVDQTQVGNIRLDATEFTNSNGVALFDFTDMYAPGQSGFAILNVEITKAFPDSTVFREFIMKITEEEVNKRTFILE